MKFYLKIKTLIIFINLKFFFFYFENKYFKICMNQQRFCQKSRLDLKYSKLFDSKLILI